MKRRRIQLSYPKKVRGGVRQSPLQSIKHISVRDFIKRPNKMFFVLLLSVVFLLLAAVLYNFQDLLPRFRTSSKEIVKPNVEASDINTFYTALKKKNIQFDNLKNATESSTLVVHLTNGGYAYLDFNRDPGMQADTLSLIIQRVTIESPQKKLKYIDLRHQKAIVKF